MSISFHEARDTVAMYRSLRKKGLTARAAMDTMRTMGIEVDASDLPTSPGKFLGFSVANDRKDNFPYYHHRRKF